MIKSQIKLPISVAFSVSFQGIKVRFARSVVTVTGVMLGIAFLMSILTGQVIKRGVAQEEELRSEVRRMLNFLAAEMGPVRGRTIGVVRNGPLSLQESRLLRRLSEGQPEALRVAVIDESENLRLPDKAERVPLSEVGSNANAVIVMGDADTQALDLRELTAGARYPMVCFTRQQHTIQPAENVRTVKLEREIPEDEVYRRIEQAGMERTRGIWIVVISLLVTVIGITNSMLMSVTERFREIGTMKCLGALSSFIRQLFLIESSLIGLVGAFLGAVVGMVFSFFAYWLTYQWLVFQAVNVGLLAIFFVASLVVGVILAVLAAIYPAKFASNMLPAHALRSTI